MVATVCNARATVPVGASGLLHFYEKGDLDPNPRNVRWSRASGSGWSAELDVFDGAAAMAPGDWAVLRTGDADVHVVRYALAGTFEAVATGPDEPSELPIEGRVLHARRRAGGAVWFDFAALCEGPRSQRDYLELARRFAVMLVSGVPVMGPERADAARRFTWLVDILYDHRVKLVLSADAPAEALYPSGRNAHEFARTASRLHEMQSRDWRGRPHLT